MLPAPVAAAAAPAIANGPDAGSIAAPGALPAGVVASVQGELAKLGVALQPSFVAHALLAEMEEGALPQLSAYITANAGSSSAAAAASVPPALLQSCRDACWSRVLCSSLARADVGARRLPALPDRGILSGTHVLELFECVDVAHSNAELAEKPVRDERVWKMRLTDGVELYTAFERRRCPAMTHKAMQPGVKLALRDVPVRYRVLMLEPGNVEVLGGGAPPDGEDEQPDGRRVAALEHKQKEAAERDEEKHMQGPLAAASAPVHPRPVGSMTASAASSFSAAAAHSSSAPSAFVAASSLPVPPQPQPQQPSIWQRGAVQQLPQSSFAPPARASGATLAPTRPAPLPVQPQQQWSDTRLAEQPLPMPVAHDDDDEFMEDEAGLEAQREVEAEERRQQLQSAAQRPLITTASLLSPEPDGDDGGGMAQHDGQGEAESALPKRADSFVSQRSASSLSQKSTGSMPGLETADPILAVLAKPPPPDPVEEVNSASAAPALPAISSTSGFLSLLTPPSTRSPVHSVATPQTIPILTPMSLASSATGAGSSPATATRTSPAVSAADAASSVWSKRRDNTASAASPSAASPSLAADTPASSTGRARKKVQRSTDSPIKLKMEAGAGGSGGPMDAFLVRGGGSVQQQQQQQQQPQRQSQRDSGSSRDSSPDSSVILVDHTPAPSSRPARPVVKAEFRGPSMVDDTDDFLEHEDAVASAAAASAAATAATAATGVMATGPSHPDSTAHFLVFSPPPPADELSPSSLRRGLEVSKDVVPRLFPASDPGLAQYSSLPYTSLQLLPALARRLERPLHVLVRVRMCGILGFHADAASGFVVRVRMLDASGTDDARFAPSWVESVFGCTQAQWARMGEAQKGSLSDKLQEFILAQDVMLQMRVQPHSVHPAPTSAPSPWVTDLEPQILHVRPVTEEDACILQAPPPERKKR